MSLAVLAFLCAFCQHVLRLLFPGTNVSAQHPQANLYVRVEEVQQTTELDKSQQANGEPYKTMVMVHVKTLKEGGIAEDIELVSNDDSTQKMSVRVTAKVLHGNQGNPLLKDGVHMISHEDHDESEWTEWPGHTNDDIDD